MKHTPTANEVLTKLAGVLHRIPQAERDIIITACNSHDELVSALKNYTLCGTSREVKPMRECLIDAESALKSAGVSL
jgi:hypothetical protein